jgi:Holliday junction resolvasome RuvABC endonuclease subunit
MKTISVQASVILPDQAELALIEGPALDADYGNSWDRAHVWWTIVDTLIDRKIPVAEIAPATLKKWATKNGRADKRLMVAAMASMWPGLGCTTNEQRHHECESLAMATMCAQRLGWPVPARPHQSQSHVVVRWPAAA